MKTIIKKYKPVTIEEFAERHGLTMEVHQRDPSFKPDMQFYARFRNAELKQGGFLLGMFGNGRDAAAAIRQYALAISEKLLVIDAYKKGRKEIQVPILT